MITATSESTGGLPLAGGLLIVMFLLGVAALNAQQVFMGKGPWHRRLIHGLVAVLAILAIVYGADFLFGSAKQ